MKFGYDKEKIPQLKPSIEKILIEESNEKG
jgi:hypothetical protein